MLNQKTNRTTSSEKNEKPISSKSKKTDSSGSDEFIISSEKNLFKVCIIKGRLAFSEEVKK